MESSVVWITAAFFGGLFLLLSFWQRKIAGVEAEKVVESIRDSRERGTNRAIAQHPQIDAQVCIGCGSCVTACPENGVLGLVKGVAHVIHGSRCIGHAKCADACPVAALTVGLGDVSGRTDIPLLSSEFETSVQGMFIAGELGGIALIRNAIEQGTRVVEAIAGRVAALPNTASPGVVDVLIVGSGPAGLAASLKAIECGLSYRTIDQDEIGGTVRKYPRRKLTMTQPVDLPLYGRMKKHEYVKEELIDLWDGIIRDAKMEIGTRVKLTGIRHAEGIFSAETSTGEIRSRFVVLALGRRGTPRRLGVPGEDAEKVMYQLIDAATYRQRSLLVVGGGDSAIEAATGLANQLGNRVTLSYRKENFFRLKPRNEDRIREYEADGRVRVIFSSQPREIGADSVLLSIKRGEEEQLEEIPNHFAFIFAGGEPPYPLLGRMGVHFGGADEAHDEDTKPALAHAGP